MTEDAVAGRCINVIRANGEVFYQCTRSYGHVDACGGSLSGMVAGTDKTVIVTMQWHHPKQCGAPNLSHTTSCSREPGHDGKHRAEWE